ncbi:MAG: YdcH family protein [Sphingomonadales bacterium]|nr:YdcH family protein [Sphingomonadales bacterium]MBP7136026.1 YdcH family protein [Sphingomonadaceae bacterium]MBK6719816.1 YdcH family protein [Sphingomonadales bacterium]MBK8271751.1 YdcH family protein [Sphingomonadales bacterium]MBK8861363.1 YdcH family protein [Sphingomonadales bacterium]
MTTKAFMLLLRHKQIDDIIRAEQKKRWQDVTRIQRLKKLKLAVKDRLHRLAGVQGHQRTA